MAPRRAAAAVVSRLQTRQDYCYNPPKIPTWSAAVWYGEIPNLFLFFQINPTRLLTF
ncbi:MAG: hypothetical protein ACJ706_00820 [Nitrososphaeraceae archaeon]